MAKEILVHKLTLSTDKVVLLREMKISDSEVAVQAVSGRAGDNQSLLSVMLQKELLKMLIVQIDGKEIPKAQLETLDKHLTYPEYTQCLRVVSQLAGTDTPLPTTEVVSYGDK